MKRSELKALIKEVVQESGGVEETTNKVWEQISELRYHTRRTGGEKPSNEEMYNNHMRLAAACKRYLEEFNKLIQ
jgi:hypothetical protein